MELGQRAAENLVHLQVLLTVSSSVAVNVLNLKVGLRCVRISLCNKMGQKHELAYLLTSSGMAVLSRSKFKKAGVVFLAFLNR